jgi:hypothetical protein
MDKHDKILSEILQFFIANEPKRGTIKGVQTFFLRVSSDTAEWICLAPDWDPVGGSYEQRKVP